MSFACHIWEYPWPRDSAEVDLIREVLEGSREPQNPWFIELARRLTARHPCITTIEDEERMVWSDGPLDGVSDSPVYGLGILSRHIDTVFPFVVDTANALGLVVTEEVAGCTYRPDGAIIDFDPKADAPRLSSRGVDMTRLGEMLLANLADVAQAHGFRRVGYSFVRGMEGGWQALAVRVAEVDGRVLTDVSVDIYFHEVTRLVRELDPELRAGNPRGRAFNLSAAEFIDRPDRALERLSLDDPSKFLPLVRAMKPVVAGKLLALAEECRTRLSATRERLAARLPCGHETVIVSSFGPGGPKVGIIGPGR